MKTKRWAKSGDLAGFELVSVRNSGITAAAVGEVIVRMGPASWHRELAVRRSAIALYFINGPTRVNRSNKIH